MGFFILFYAMDALLFVSLRLNLVNQNFPVYLFSLLTIIMVVVNFLVFFYLKLLIHLNFIIILTYYSQINFFMISSRMELINYTLA